MRKLALLLVWFGSSTVTLFISLSFLIYLTQIQALKSLVHLEARLLAEQTGTVAFAALPKTAGDVLGVVKKGDARALVVQRFFEQYNAPLAAYAEAMVEASDRYNLPDFRLLPAIAMQESNGCKLIPYGSNNCWGYGIYGSQSLGFPTMEAAIDRVARGLKEDYYDKGLTTPYQIMTKYTPPSIAKGGPWAKGVEYFLSEME